MKSKILSVVITFLLLLFSLPLCVTADAGVTVCDETELIAALEIGGKITIGATIILSDSVSVTKDTVIDLNGNTQVDEKAYRTKSRNNGWGRFLFFFYFIG